MSNSALTIGDIVKRTTDLPTLSAAALRVFRQTDDPNVSAASLAETIIHDQALAARVLRLSNSAYYGLSRRVEAVQDAVILLGMRCVRNLALVAATYPWLVRPLKGYHLGPKEMWTHAIGVAIGAELVAKRAGSKAADTAFTAGLLHDLGKLALNVWLEDLLEYVRELAVEEGIAFDEAERMVLGFDHTEVGAHLALSWNLPESLTLAIRHHHNPSACEPANDLVDAVHIGDYLTMAMGFGLGGDGLAYRFDESALQRLNLDVESLDELTDAFVMDYERHEAMYQEMVPR